MHRLTATDTPMVRYTRTIFPSYAHIATSICRYIYISFPPVKKIERSTYLELKIQGFKSP